MGAKFYRGADKPKKIRKRFFQTRSWFRTLKWVSCKHITYPITTVYRSRTSCIRTWTPLQGWLGLLYRPNPSPRSQEIRHQYSCLL